MKYLTIAILLLASPAMAASEAEHLADGISAEIGHKTPTQPAKPDPKDAQIADLTAQVTALKQAVQKAIEQRNISENAAVDAEYNRAYQAAKTTLK